MNLEHLQRFLLVIERGSIGEAARDLGISQAAMSKSIQRLEASVRTKLFERTKNGMVPNIYGVALMRRAQSLILSAEKAAVEIREMLEGTSGRVKSEHRAELCQHIGYAGGSDAISARSPEGAVGRR